jgi:beta-lactamase superfamily II metal-dependent hydrolase
MKDPFFRIELLPAAHGDALWVEYGKGKTVRRILIDGGPIHAYEALEEKLITLPEGDQRVELVVITHVDTDHIEGIIRLFAEHPSRWLIAPQDIWFNGWRHIQETEILGGREGDFLSALISNRAGELWNKAFDKHAIVIRSGESLPVIVLDDGLGMKLTLLSPDEDKLNKMALKWEKDVDKYGLDPGDLEGAWEQLLEKKRYLPDDGLLGGVGEINDTIARQLKTDPSAANGASISFLAEFEGKSCLFLADAHAGMVADSIKKLIPQGKKRLKVDAFKMSHHGSKNNISKALLKLVDAKHFLVSTNGAIHEHPDKPAIEAVIQGSLQAPELWFNYSTPFTEPWKDGPAPGQRPFITHYPQPGMEGIVLEL